MPEPSKNLIQALDRIRETLADQEPGHHDYHFPQLTSGPVERVLAFNNDEEIRLHNLDGKEDPKLGPFFSSHGVLTDVWSQVIPGSRVETTFPVDPSIIEGGNTQPDPQKKPFDRPPVDEKNTTGNGYSKQAYYFEDGYFVTVGPSLPKIVRLANGGAQFWVGSIGVITQGTGVFEGARGVTTYVGSAYLEKWPEKFEDQAKILVKGFKARIGTFVKFVPSSALPG